jgi:glycosyltransferase involved in cell wall biosynthesis
MGRLTVQKAHDILIKAAAEVCKRNQNVEFIIAGEGPLFGYLDNLIQEHGLVGRFHLLGYRNDVFDIFRVLDLFVLSSIDEGLPIVLLEAMSIGAPVVATDVGEIPYVIDHEKSGIIVPKNNVNILASMIEDMLVSEKRRRKFASAARVKVVSHYSLKIMSEKYQKVYSHYYL